MTTASNKIALIDYGMGNTHSVAKALEYVGATVVVTDQAQTIAQADRVVFPGQGAMHDCMRALNAHQGLFDSVAHACQQKPFLGICVGLQLLYEHGEEGGGCAGLGVIKGAVRRINPSTDDRAAATLAIKVPHMGWNQVRQSQPHPLWAHIPDNSHFYFDHSYIGWPQQNELVCGTVLYGHSYPAAVCFDRLFAVQFHPEKSDVHGLQLLKNFVEWMPD